MARIRIHSGGARSDRERAIDTLAAEHWGHALLVVPTRHEANARAERIVQEFATPGAWDVCVVSFEDFVLRLLRGAGVFAVEMDDIERRTAIACAIGRVRESGALTALGSAAESAGFANHMLRVIAKLKQAAVDPKAFRAAAGRRARASWLDPVVADVYETYQELLHAAGAYDRVGVYWQAREVLESGAPRLFDRVRHVYFDGFDDFTPSELRVIEQLPRYVETLGFGIVCDAESPSARDLYVVPRETHAHLRSAFPAATPHTHAAPPPQTRTEFVAANLFWRDKPRAPAGLREDLTLQPCHDAKHECEWIGRAVKTLVLERRADPNAIAVVYRRIEDIAPRLRTVFGEFQIPLRIHAPRPASDSAFAAFLLRALEVHPAWEREAVLDVLASRWSGAPIEHAAAYGYLARTAGIIEGRREWDACLARLQTWLAAGAGERRDAVLRRVPRAVEAASSLIEQVDSLGALLRAVPAKGTRRAYAAAVLTVIDALRPERVLATLDDDHREFEACALPAMRAALLRMRAWDGRLPEAGPIALADFLIELRAAFGATAVDGEDAAHGVQAMSAETARYRDYDYLFLAGLNEGAFPAPPATDAVYSDEDWDDLDRAGAPVEKRSRQMEREMLLLHHVIGRARAGVYMTWCAAGPDGRPLARSPFLDDVQGLLEDSAARGLRPAPFLPTVADAASARDLRRADGVTSAIASAFADAFVGLDDGLRAERERYSAAPFGAYDAVLGDAGLIAQLADAYGPEHAFSAAQLETYAECPFQFFLERVLRVEADAAPEEEFDPRTRGRILHDALHQFHAAFCGVPLGALPERDARETMLRISGEVFDRHARGEVTAPRGVVRAERARMQAQLLRYLAIGRELDEPWTPAYFEIGFGRAHADGETPPAKTAPYSLDTAVGPVLLSGRIDRIDLHEGAARIVDYKTTVYSRAKDMAEGVSLQMPLYAVALERYLMPDTECAEARLVQPGRRKGEEALQKARGKWPEREEAMRQGVARAVAGIRQGQFPPRPHRDRCEGCALSRVCRYEAWRIERKVQDDGPADA